MQRESAERHHGAWRRSCDVLVFILMYKHKHKHI